MYSLILMTAMAQSPTGPEFNGHFRNQWLGNGCTGSTANSTSCNGCSGCSCHGGLFSGERIRSFFSFNGGSCNGCCGGTSYSCSGAPVSYGCCGAVTLSCTGGGFDMGMPFQSYPDMGTPYATPVPTAFYSGGCFGMAAPGMPMMPALPSGQQLIPPTTLPMGDGTTPYAQPAPAISEFTPKNQLPLPGGAAATPNRATVIVKLPADARLYAEGKPLRLTSAERAFVTPELPQGRDYNYTFRVEYDREGRTVTDARTVAVTPGKVSNVEFNDLASGKVDPIPKAMPESIKPAMATSLPKSEPVGERARFTVKVPAGATLFVNDAKQNANEFRTPPLPAGQQFSYVMKIESLRNGYPEQVSQKVTFRAGDNLTVDFTDTQASR